MSLLWGKVKCLFGFHGAYYWATSHGDVCARCGRRLRQRWQRIDEPRS